MNGTWSTFRAVGVLQALLINVSSIQTHELRCNFLTCAKRQKMHCDLFIPRCIPSAVIRRTAHICHVWRQVIRFLASRKRLRCHFTPRKLKYTLKTSVTQICQNFEHSQIFLNYKWGHLVLAKIRATAYPDPNRPAFQKSSVKFRVKISMLFTCWNELFSRIIKCACNCISRREAHQIWIETEQC